MESGPAAVKLKSPVEVVNRPSVPMGQVPSSVECSLIPRRRK